MSVRSRSNWNLEVLDFKERGKLEYPCQGTASRSKGEKKHQTQPIYMALTDLDPGRIVGRRVLSPLRNFYNYNLQFTNFNYNCKKIPVSKRDHRVKKKELLTF